MGIFDHKLILDEDIDLSTAATTLSANSYDTQTGVVTGAAVNPGPTQNNRIDIGTPLFVSLDITGDFGGTAATLQFAVVSSANANLSSASVEVQTRAYAAADIVYAAAGQNSQIVLPLSWPLRTHQPSDIPRYLGAQITVAGTSLTAGVTGKIRIALFEQLYGQPYYESGFSV